MLKAVLFDLDGTLLPMHESEFIKKYGELLFVKMSKLGLDGQKLGKLIWTSMDYMNLSDGSKGNDVIFDETFKEFYQEEADKYKEILLDYYSNDFLGTKAICKDNPLAKSIVNFVKENNLICILATNPVYPKVATKNRMNFIGLEESDFDIYTHHGNSRFTKTNPKYYQDLLDKFNLKPEEVLLFGNNTYEDGETSLKCNIKTFLIDGYVIFDKRSTNNFEIIKMEDVIPTIKKYIENI